MCRFGRRNYKTNDKSTFLNQSNTLPVVVAGDCCGEDGVFFFCGCFGLCVSKFKFVDLPPLR